ncbi:MAG: hypothetical protein NVSMB55_10540 [Mycobacteriales bacterium]
MTADHGAAVASIPEPGQPRSWEQRSPYEGSLWVIAGLLVAVVVTWPLATQLRSVIPHDAADPLAQAWVAAWSGHALLHQPMSLFDANTFWPEGPSLAFSDSLLGYLPAGLFGSGPGAALVRYNMLFLAAYALAFAGVALLARELGVRPAAAAVAAAAFSWAPLRMAQEGHLNIMSTGGIALALFLLLAGYRRGRIRQIILGWLVAAWQVSLGFGLGIYFCYVLALMAIVAGIEWLRRGRPGLQRPTVIGTTVGGGAFVVLVGLFVTPYLEVLRRYPDAPRSRAEVAFYSPPLRSFFAADAQSRVWGHATEFVRATLPWPPEQTLFPGLVVTALAVVGLARRRSSTRLRVALLTSVVVGALLSLGLSLHGGSFTYGPLYDVLPGWKGLRTPGRLSVFWSLALALLAGLGAQRLLEGVHGSRVVGPRYRAAVGSVLALTCAALVLWEGSPRLPLPSVPQEPAGLFGLADPQVHLPASSPDDDVYMLWSTDGFPRIANGNASYLPPSLSAVRGLTAFPDPPSVLLLRSRGYRTVVLHTDRAAGTPWADAASRPLDGLGVTSRRVGSLVIYDLGRG